MSKYINLAYHPHPLTLLEGTGTTFHCNLCWCRGYGSSYRCAAPDCDYRIHETCAASADSLRFFGHPQHPLALEPAGGGHERCCDLCTYCINGLHYGCRACGFFLHLVCATLPASAIPPAHPQHFVTLVPGKGAQYSWECESCDGDCDGWHYVCAPCGVRLHPSCLLRDGDKDRQKTPLCIC